MNCIDIKQNTNAQLERLAAQRELYSSAKLYFKFQIAGNILIPLLLSILSIYYFNLPVYSAVFGICFLIIDITLIDPAIIKRKVKATKIQELFDCDVLEIPKSPLKTADDVMVEEVLNYYDAHSKIKGNIERIKNWYPLNNELIDISIARIICQRTNCWWDSKLRQAYSVVLKVIGVFVILLMIILGVFGNYEFIQIVLIGSGLIPFFQFCIKQFSDNIDAIHRYSLLNTYILSVWEDIKHSRIAIDKLDESSRRIQDEIYEGRIRNPLIPDSFYKIYRIKDELLSEKTTDILIKDIREHVRDKLKYGIKIN